ncbi:hypothetical protein YC2023_077131 [Brassica napus]
MKEERRSVRIAREEDEMEAKLIAEEEERERQRKLLKLRRKKTVFHVSKTLREAIIRRETGKGSIFPQTGMPAPRQLSYWKTHEGFRAVDFYWWDIQVPVFYSTLFFNLSYHHSTLGTKCFLK